MSEPISQTFGQAILDGVTFAPLLPWPAIAVLSAVAALLLAIILLRRGRGWVYRALALTVLVAAVANPSVIREERQPKPDLAVVVVDESQSQTTIGDRVEQTESALASVESALRRFPDLETRVVRVRGGGDGTELFAAAASAVSDEPDARLAGVVMITDGQVHDVPEGASPLPPNAPLHVLLTGGPDELDRRMVVEQAPAYGLVGEPVDIAYRVEDTDASVDDMSAEGAAGEQAAPWTRQGGGDAGGAEREAAGAGQVMVRIRVDGVDAGAVPATVGETRLFSFTVDHAGPSVVELEAQAEPGELSAVNNRAVVTVNGVRDRLKVLLVSGQPHLGERTWRNLLKSDPSVDLVHFTILRPPEKDDLAPIFELSLIAFPVQELFEDQLYNFDLIVFDRYVVRSVLPWRYLDETASYVEDGGAILLDVGPEFAGFASLYQTPLGRIMPGAPTDRIIEQAYRPQVTDLGRRHPVTSALPGESVIGDAAAEDNAGGPAWGRWFRLIEAESTRGDVLMEGPAGRPLLIVDRVGKGRVAQLLSDHIWLWARGYDGGGPHAELIRRLLHWLMKEPELEEERLNAFVDDGRLVIERHSLGTEPVQVTVAAPDGSTRSVRLEPGDDGIARAEVPAPGVGLYRVDDATHMAMAASGSANPKEFMDLKATPRRLAPAVQASGGAIAWIAGGVPEFRRTLADRDAAGRGWMGLRRNGYAVVSGSDQVPLLPPLLVLAVTLIALGAAWWREGH